MKNINGYFDFLYKLERTDMKYDLSNITKLCKDLGNPQEKFRSIHIAGTNGKGATASFTASALMEHGLKTGLFTSPHILNFNERIRINGKTIGNNYIRRFLDQNIKLIKKIKPSFFEVNTAMAFNYFADNNVDAAVIECGLGGRLDSTNILKPDISVITQIDMDHMQFLGNTLKAIAKEKLGIVKPGIKTIVSDNNPALIKLFHSYINYKELVYLDDIAGIRIITRDQGKMLFSLKLKGKDKIIINSPLLGNYQARNISASYLAVNEYLSKNKIKFSIQKFKKAVKNVKFNTGYFGRFEVMKLKGRKFLFDVSHNPDGIKKALMSMKGAGFKPNVIIFGIMSDKDHRNSLKEIIKYSGNIILTKPDYFRAQEPGILYEYAKRIGGNINIMIAGSVKDSLNIAENLKYKNILIIGSFFLVSDAMKTLGYRKLPN